MRKRSRNDSPAERALALSDNVNDYLQPTPNCAPRPFPYLLQRLSRARGGLSRSAGSAGTQHIWLPAFPTTRISYAKLADMSTRSSVVTLEAVTQQIIDHAEMDVDALELTADSSLQSQGLDSLKVMSLVFKIEEHFDIVLDEEDADDLRTVGDLAALVVRRIEQQP